MFDSIPAYQGFNVFDKVRQQQQFAPSAQQQDVNYQKYLQMFNQAGGVIAPYATGSRSPFEYAPGQGDQSSYERARQAWMASPMGQQAAMRPAIQVGRTGGGSSKLKNEQVLRNWVKRPNGSTVLQRQNITSAIGDQTNRNALEEAIANNPFKLAQAKIQELEARTTSLTARAALARAKAQGDEQKAAKIVMLSDEMGQQTDPAVIARYDKALAIIAKGGDVDNAIKFARALASEEARKTADTREFTTQRDEKRNAFAEKFYQMKQADRERLASAQQQFQSDMATARTQSARIASAERMATVLDVQIKKLQLMKDSYGVKFQGIINGVKQPSFEQDAVVKDINAQIDDYKQQIQMLKQAATQPFNAPQPTIRPRRGQLTDPQVWQQYLARAGGDQNAAEQLAAADGWE